MCFNDTIFAYLCALYRFLIVNTTKMKCKDIELGIVVQARLGSNRLPNKVIRQFANHQCILEIILEKFHDSEFQNISKILATTTAEADRIMKQYADNANFVCFRGSETDVLRRFIDVGEKYRLTHIIRVCADNPFLNVSSVKILMDELNNRMAKEEVVDYLSFRNQRQIPAIKTHWGLFAEIVSLEALRKVARTTDVSIFHEHVTNFIYEHDNMFRVAFLDAPPAVYDRHDIRLTVDDLDDFTMLSGLYEETLSFSDDLEQLIAYIDNCQTFDYRSMMIENIKKYSK